MQNAPLTAAAAIAQTLDAATAVDPAATDRYPAAVQEAARTLLGDFANLIALARAAGAEDAAAEATNVANALAAVYRVEY
jgi:hypothetical protein